MVLIEDVHMSAIVVDMYIHIIAPALIIVCMIMMMMCMCEFGFLTDSPAFVVVVAERTIVYAFPSLKVMTWHSVMCVMSGITATSVSPPLHGHSQ